MNSDNSDIQFTELKDMIIQLNKTITSLNETIEKQNKKMDEKDRVIADLTAQLDFLKTKLFGSTSEIRKNEIPGQYNLFDNPDIDDKPVIPIDPEFIEVASHKRNKKHKATYDEMFENIKTTQVKVDSLSKEDRICPECGSEMIPIGTEILRTKIVYHEPSLEKIEYVGTTYRCPNADKEADTIIVKDKCTKPALIDGSYVSSSLAAHVMYSKYVMSMPLYRQEKDFEHLGVKIGRGTMANWIITCSNLYLKPIYDYLFKKLSERLYLMADETPIQVLKEPERRPQSKSYVWVVRTGEDDGIPIILFKYTPTRKEDNAADILKATKPGFYLMTDGYKGYNKVPQANRCACWAHIRRYWLKAIPKGHEHDYNHPAVQGFLYCEKLFYYERQYKEKGLSIKQTYKRRLKDQEPVIDAFLSWIDQLHPKTGDSIIKAINYTNGCRPYLKNYLKDGACSLSNNLSENAIRPLVVGRKNWLFSDTQEGADASTIVFSIVETAKANEIDSLKYLNYLLKNRPTKDTPENVLEQLSPWSNNVRKQCKI